MIPTHKIKRLSQEEIATLLYCINDGVIDDPFVTEENLSCAKQDYAFKMLNLYAAKLTDDAKKRQMQEIADKITNP